MKYRTTGYVNYEDGCDDGEDDVDRPRDDVLSGEDVAAELHRELVSIVEFVEV